MPLREQIAPVLMRRVALVAPAAALRDVLAAVAALGAVELVAAPEEHDGEA